MTATRVISNAQTRRWEPPPVEGELLLDDGSRRKVQIPTARDLQAIEAAAQEEGYRAGHAEGLAAGTAEAQARLAASIDTFNAVLSTLSGPLEDLDEDMVQSIADLALTIARHIVRRELRTDPGEVVPVVRQALGALPVSQRRPRIRLNPEDVAIIAHALGMDDDDRNWRLEPDPLVSRGGCLVETDSSFIDATVESRIAAIASQMFGSERQRDAEPETDE